MDEEMMKVMGFSGFGAVKKVEKKQVKSLGPVTVLPAPAAKKTEPSPVKPPNLTVNQEQPQAGGDSDAENDSDSDESVDLTDRLPFAAACSLNDHDRSVTSISLDPAQSRLITGGRDNYVKLWDFNSMKGNFKPFKTIEPAEGSPVRDVQWGIKGDCFLVAPSNWQPMIFDRNGEEVSAYTKGDPYIRDLKHVKGHTAALTCVRWHPSDQNTFMSASFDSTVKLWDLHNRRQCKATFFTPSMGHSEKLHMTAAVFNSDGRNIISGDSGGNIRFWVAAGTQTRASLTISDAHAKGTPITSVQMSLNGHNLISRSMDDTLKLWDSRNPKKPVGVQSNLNTLHEEANCIYSPNERYVLTGTATRKDEGNGYICVFDSKTLDEVGRVQLSNSAVRLLWPSKMEQLFCGMGDGDIKVHYDPQFSTKGVILPILKAETKLTVEDYDKFIGGVEAVGEVEEEYDPVALKKARSQWTKERNATKPGLDVVLMV
ncbi:hypothetical protein HDU91_004969 [Kappamyces sp. JEL0680]|nr:hypothetical protein HDU91_004969 [Kappamyces sp. JEL0680]